MTFHAESRSPLIICIYSESFSFAERISHFCLRIAGLYSSRFYTLTPFLYLSPTCKIV